MSMAKQKRYHLKLCLQMDGLHEPGTNEPELKQKVIKGNTKATLKLYKENLSAQE